MARVHIFLAGIVASGIFQVGPAFAADEAAQPGPAASPSAPIVSPEETSPRDAKPQFGNDAPFASAAVVEETKLADITGMADVNVIEQAANVRNTSTITGNIINGDPTTGTISFDGGSFGAFNGLALVSANTGNNVSINSAMNVNVAIQ
ncbi:hypothetical protein WBP07_30815 [Novosphingobium sp. BL-8A]|uniref:hypothetical protein n=1 Tax=Novosphingobium sp. BL-8A TaxID=3127639 RepID=UPI003756CB41